MRFLIKNDVAKASSEIVIGEESVIKVFDRSIDLEKIVRKHLQITEVLKAHDIVTPEVICADESRHSIEFTKLPLKEHIGKQLQYTLNCHAPPEVDTSLFENIGRVLGLIHRDLKLDSKTNSMPQGEGADEAGQFKLSAVGDSVFFHGDFSLNNIFTINNRIFVIDPVPNQTTMFHIDEFGNHEIELAYLCNSVLRQLSYRHFHRKNTRLLSKLLEQLIQGYEKVTGRKINMESLRRKILKTDVKVAQKRINSRLARGARATATRFLISRTI